MITVYRLIWIIEINVFFIKNQLTILKFML